ncbi:calcium uniporter protein, mitochondrial [Daktulosphaira vitifoliae]|uniref:calcium uniporter protein, mitochondrial n=1 Tax=Daktulosphaira vitifoliae TaxID=58002 RepID=UPI0021A9E39A|nr:calcium uniporter protein, mitochondrial [Daktulosphaira vitifoliae]
MAASAVHLAVRARTIFGVAYREPVVSKICRTFEIKERFRRNHCKRWSSTVSSTLSCDHDKQTPVKSTYNDSELHVELRRGLPTVTIPLPSRRELCQFTLRPVSNSVGDFTNMLKTEDKGVDHVVVSNLQGVRIASSNTIESLMEGDFRLAVNDRDFIVKVPPHKKLTQEDMERLSGVRTLVSQLYESLNVEEHQIKKERELLSKLEDIKLKLEPLEKKRQSIDLVANRQTSILTWVGLGLMSVQFGILARLTWWEYSWDIMEPVTYFVTYGTAMAVYAYYVLTKQEYLMPDVRDRQYLITMHKKAKKSGLDLYLYNQLKDQLSSVQTDLARLKDPLIPPHRAQVLHDPLDGEINTNNIYGGQFSSILSKIKAQFKFIRDDLKSNKY